MTIQNTIDRLEEKAALLRRMEDMLVTGDLKPIRMSPTGEWLSDMPESLQRCRAQLSMVERQLAHLRNIAATPFTSSLGLSVP